MDDNRRESEEADGSDDLPTLPDELLNDRDDAPRQDDNIFASEAPLGSEVPESEPPSEASLQSGQDRQDDRLLASEAPPGSEVPESEPRSEASLQSGEDSGQQEGEINEGYEDLIDELDELPTSREEKTGRNKQGKASGT